MELEDRIGPIIRQQRKLKGLTLADLSARTGLSISHMSQIERGLASPSLSALHQIGSALGIRVSELIYACEPTSLSTDGLISRRADRTPVTIPGSKAYSELISREGSDIQLAYTIAPPGSSVDPHEKILPGEECGFVLSGKMRLHVGDEAAVLQEGDACFIHAFTPHCWENAGDEDLKMVWAFISSPLQ